MNTLCMLLTDAGGDKPHPYTERAWETVGVGFIPTRAPLSLAIPPKVPRWDSHVSRLQFRPVCAARLHHSTGSHQGSYVRGSVLFRPGLRNYLGDYLLNGVTLQRKL